MPAPDEIAAYQMGVRLTQCRLLHQLCATPWNGDLRPPGPAEIADVRESLVLLRRAIASFVKLGALDDSHAQILVAIVVNCLRLWKTWSRVSPSLLGDGEIDTSEFYENLDSLEDRVRSIIGPPPRTKLDWFVLGKEISDVNWRVSDDGRHAKVLNKEMILQRARERPKDKWVWSNPRRLRRLCRRIGFEKDALFPKVGRTKESIGLLPYSPAYCWPWFRIEAGLTKAVQLLPQAVRTCFQHESEDATELVPPVAHDQDEQLALRLTVDVNKKLAFLDGIPFSLGSDEAACFVQALIDAKGDWQSAADIAKRYPVLKGVRPGRIKTDTEIPAPILALIETEDAKGSRIPISKLLPESLVSKLWPDHA